MIQVGREGDMIVFEVKGLHRFWALKRRLEIPRAHIRSVRRDSQAARGWQGWRAPGTYIPGLVTAGTFYLKGRRRFCDFCHPQNTIVVDLDGEVYHQLIIEVQDPDAAISLLAANP